MEGKYVLIKKRGRIYLAYVHGGKIHAYTSVHERYWEFVRLVAGGDEIYDIITVMRIFVLMKILPRVRDAVRATDVVREMRDFEVLFWYVKLARVPAAAVNAFKALYGLR